MNGFVSLHRKIVEWEWYTDADTFRVFIHLLMMANYAPAKVRGIDVARGQHVTSTVRLVETLNMTFSRVRKSLKRLREGGEIIVENPSNRYSLVTIVKYDAYQLSEDELIKQKSSKEHSENNQTSTNNNNNNNNKENKNNNLLLVHEWKEIYLKNERLINAVCRNNKLSKSILISEIETFVIHRMNLAKTEDEESEFNNHFRHFLAKRKTFRDQQGNVSSGYSKQAF